MTQTAENTKKSLFDAWIQDDHILVHLDARKEGVSVPSHLKDQHSLTLKLSMLFQGETRTDQENITSYLKFNNEYFECILPWSAVWGMTSDQGVQKIWEQDMPKEVFHQAARIMLQSVGDKVLAPFRKKSGSEAATPAPEPSPRPEKKDSPPDNRRSMLKRIK
jgi:stringent starvation protein B